MLEDITVLDAKGEEKDLSDAWAKGPALLMFLRHFGCIGCAEQVGLLAPRVAELQALGVNVVLVGNGEPVHIARFKEKLEVEIVTDPTLKAHSRAGMKRSVWGTYGLPAIVGHIRAFTHGYRHGGFKGDILQQGGALLIDKGEVLYAFRSKGVGDYVDLSDVVEIVLKRVAREAHV